MNIDWSKAPKNFPLWIEDLFPERGIDESGWCYEDDSTGYFMCRDGSYWGKTQEGKDIKVHRKPDTWTGEGLPPAGETPEVLGWRYSGATFTTQPHSDATPLVDHTHVTRLQAEVERFKSQLSDSDHCYRQAHDTGVTVMRERDALQSELTKAFNEFKRVREHVTRLQAEVDQHKRQAEYNQGAALHWLAEKGAVQSELTKARELLHRAHAADTAGRHELPYNVSRLMDDIEAFLHVNQSAPADKGQGEPITWLVQNKKHPDWFELAELNEKASNPSHWTDAFPVYREQPVPVAAVLTDDQIFEAIRPALDKSDGGYICDTDKESAIKAGRAVLAALDEVARLNGVKP